MNDNVLIFEHKGSKIIAVPSFHNSHIFALKVREIFLNPSFNIDCIAIELGNNILNHILKWFKKLKIDEGKKLPILLGFYKQNNLIHPIFKKKVMEYQKKTKMDLSHLNSETLFYQFGFIDHLIIPLMPMDSIIESIRCASELKIPIFGIDLDETVQPIVYYDIKVQNPENAKNDFIKFVNFNSNLLKNNTDIVILKREKVMAARLKALAENYKEILFVCGLGHWGRILEFLRDNKLKKAKILYDERDIKIIKIIISKADTIMLLGSIPKYIYEYENLRISITDLINSKTNLDPLKYFNEKKILEKIIEKSIDEYYDFSKENKKEFDKSELINFINFLKNFELLNLDKKITIDKIVQSVRYFFDLKLIQILIDQLINVPWADKSKFPDCKTYETEMGLVEIFKDLSNIIEKEKPHENKNYDETWRAWNNLVTFMCIKAIENAKALSFEKDDKTISEDLQEGIDLKKTIKCCIREENERYAKTKKKNISKSEEIGKDNFPVLWIFEPLEFQKGRYSAFYENIYWFENYFKDKNKLTEILNIRGDKMIALIGFGKKYENNITKINTEISCIKHYGLIIFNPICWEPSQNAYWLEKTDYRRNPIAFDNCFDIDLKSTLCRTLKEDCDVNLWDSKWEKTLMLIALGYAKENITFIVPENFKIDPEIYERAKTKNIKILINYLSYFPKKYIKRMQLCYSLPAIRVEDKYVYAIKYSSILKEEENDYQDLVPAYWKNYGKQKEVKI